MAKKKLYEPALSLVSVDVDMTQDPAALCWRFSPVLEEYLDKAERHQLEIVFHSVSRILVDHLRRVAGDGAIQPAVIKSVMRCAYSDATTGG